MTWCDSCQDDYDRDHYEPHIYDEDTDEFSGGFHLVGMEYGSTGAHLMAVEIVQALAAKSPGAYDYQREATCPLCWPEIDAHANTNDPANHRKKCPWRLAREWVTAMAGTTKAAP